MQMREIFYVANVLLRGEMAKKEAAGYDEILMM